MCSSPDHVGQHSVPQPRWPARRFELRTRHLSELHFISRLGRQSDRDSNAADAPLKGRLEIDSEPVEAPPAYWQNDCALGASARVNSSNIAFSEVQRCLNDGRARSK